MVAGLADGRIAAAASDGSIAVWELSPRGARQVVTLRGGGGGKAITNLAALSDGRLVSACNSESCVRVWEATGTGGRAVATISMESAPLALAVLPGDRLAVSTSGDATISVWDLGGNRVARLTGTGSIATTLAALPDGRVAGASQGETSIRVWDLAGRMTTTTLSGAGGGVPVRPFGAPPDGGVRALAALPDGRLAVCTGSKTVRLLQVSSDGDGERATTSLKTDGPVGTMAVLPDGRLACTFSAGSGGGPRAGGMMMMHVVGGAYVGGVGYDAYGNPTAATALSVWKVASGGAAVREATMAAHTNGVSALAALPDGRLVSCSATDSEVKVWGAYE